MTTFFQVTYCTIRLIQLSTLTTACLLERKSISDCQVHLKRMDDHHFLYMGHPITVRITCQGSSHTLLLSKHQVLHLPSRCSLHSPVYVIPARHNSPHDQSLTISTHLSDDTSRFLEVQHLNLSDGIAQHGVLSLKFHAKHDDFTDSDFDAQPHALFQHLHDRLRRRAQQQEFIRTNTVTTLIPVFICAGLLTILAFISCALITYIVRFA